MDATVEAVRKAFREADALLVTAGAGMGVDSGLPDFRGKEGFWKAYPPIAKLGYSFAEMADPRRFEQNPRLAWAFYGHRLNLYRRTVPHGGFVQLLEAGRRKAGGCFVFTSNVDGQFQKAGFDEERLVECHGSIHHLQCTRGCSEKIWSAEGTNVAVDMERFEAVGELPRCPKCGALARPNILMFGDWGWLPQRTELQERRFEAWLQRIVSEKMTLAVVEIGAGEAVPTVRRTSEAVVRETGGIFIRINPRDTEVPRGHYVLAHGALEGVGMLIPNGCDIIEKQSK